jgi:hypothetical protein
VEVEEERLARMVMVGVLVAAALVGHQPTSVRHE